MAKVTKDLGDVRGPIGPRGYRGHTGMTPEFSIDESGNLITEYDDGLIVTITVDNSEAVTNNKSIVMIPYMAVKDPCLVRGGTYITLVCLQGDVLANNFDTMDNNTQVDYINTTTKVTGGIEIIWSAYNNQNTSREYVYPNDNGIYSFVVKSNDPDKLYATIRFSDSIPVFPQA